MGRVVYEAISDEDNSSSSYKVLPLWADDKKKLQECANSQLDDHTGPLWRTLAQYRGHDPGSENHVTQLKRVLQCKMAKQERVKREKVLENKRKEWIQEEKHNREMHDITDAARKLEREYARRQQKHRAMQGMKQQTQPGQKMHGSSGCQPSGVKKDDDERSGADSECTEDSGYGENSHS